MFGFHSETLFNDLDGNPFFIKLATYFLTPCTDILWQLESMSTSLLRSWVENL